MKYSVLPVLPVILAAAAMACIAFSSCYVTVQGSRYAAIVARATPSATLLARTDTDSDTRRLLETARDVREYAVGTIGLKDTKNYRSLAVVDSDHLVNVVQACAQLSFDRYLWSYPFVGRLPYKGFFKRPEADDEAARIRKRGYDVIVRPADAFSTLGFLADPLFSFMTSYDEYEIAELVIHEMTHATIFVRDGGAGSFNEELATFVGRQGALDFLASRYGAGSASVRDAQKRGEESAAFSGFLRETSRQLEKVYASALSDADKRERKKETIAERAAIFARDYDSMFTDNTYRRYPMERVNNALLDLYRLYEGEPELYRDYWAANCGSDLRVFIAKLKAMKTPAVTMRKEIETPERSSTPK